jgi:two-component system chemotaxis sensor kinase CheA
MLDPTLLQDFITETTEHLEEMEASLLGLEKSPGDLELLNSIFRTVHTIKGSAEYLGLENISNLTHNLENLLERIRNGEIKINQAIIDVIISSGDVINRLIDDLEKEQAEQTPIDEVLNEILQLIKQQGNSQKSPDGKKSDDDTELVIDEPYDEELFDIFVQHLKENLTNFKETFYTLKTNDNPSEVLGKCFELVDSLISSANYMGYDQLTSSYNSLKNGIKTYQTSLLERKDSFSKESAIKWFDEHILGICKLFKITDLDEDPSEKSLSDKAEDDQETVLELPEDATEGLMNDLDLFLDEPLLEEEEVAGSSEADPLVGEYVSETKTLLNEARIIASGFKKTPDALPILNDFCRAIHTIKGGAEYQGYEKIAELSGVLENFLVTAKKAKTILSQDMIDAVMLSLDLLDKLTEEMSTSGKEQTSVHEAVSNFDKFSEALKQNDKKDVQTGPEPISKIENDDPSIYEEDYDSELLDIFMQQLKEELAWFVREANSFDDSADPVAIVAKLKEKLALLRSSANYMGYDNLTTVYEEWKKELEDNAENIARHADIVKSIIDNTKKIAAFFPKSNILADIPSIEDIAETETIEESTEVETLNDLEAAPSLFETLDEAFSEKISGMTIIDENPNDVVSDFLFSDEINPEQFINNATVDAAKDLADLSSELLSEELFKEKLKQINAMKISGMDEKIAEQDTGETSVAMSEGLAKDTGVQNIKEQTNIAFESENIEAGDRALKFADRIQTQNIRVDANKIDSLMNQVGELVVSRAWFSQLHHEMRDLKQELLQNDSIDQRLSKKIKQMTFRLYEATGALGRAANDLQEGVMRIRMLPVARLFNRYPRLIHDLIKDTDKQVDLEIKGEDTELDKMVIEKISDPMIHIIRNAIDHGIESSSERKRIGKPVTAKLTIEAYHESNNVVIEVTDDGRGIDPDKIRAKAIDSKLMEQIEIDNLADREITSLIMKPGFSTATSVTHTSGRGVGMDVVKKNIEKLNGTIEIDSIPGTETRIRIKIPLTLAIIPALLVRVETELFTIPLSAVEEAIKIHINDIKSIDGNEVIYLRNNTIPLVRLKKIFNIPMRKDNDEKLFIVIVGNGMNQIGLVVDAMLGQEEVVIKPLEDYLQESSGFSGATILGDGRISLILDIYDLMNISMAKMGLRRKAKEAVMI